MRRSRQAATPPGPTLSIWNFVHPGLIFEGRRGEAGERLAWPLTVVECRAIRWRFDMLSRGKRFVAQVE